MTSELVARLRRTYRREYAPTGSTVGSIENRLRPFPILATEVPLNPDGPEAAAEIERLTAQLAEARQAERAAVVTFLSGNATLAQFHWGAPLIAAIEAGEHLKKEGVLPDE